MTRRAISLVLAVLALLGAAQAAAAASPPLLALCYHDVVDARSAAGTDPDGMTVTLDALVAQLAWLDAEGYQPITLDTWMAAADGGALPDKPVLLTFDDGYASFHRHVLPLLELFGFPAVLAPVTAWIDAPAGSRVRYGDQQVSRERFMTWADLRDVRDSGLVEIATHSHDLHHGVPGNPFGNTQPAAVTRRFLSDTDRYEPEADYDTRIRHDLARSIQLIERHLGSRPRTMVWPYGAYNATATAAARAMGLARSLTLDATGNAPPQRNVHRHLIGSDVTLREFVMTVRGLYPPAPLRAAHVDLDYVYDPDPAQQGRNLDRLLDRIKALGINRVFLQAFADPDGNGVADALYFRNRHLPMRADLFNRVAWQLRTRAGVRVVAWMPVLSFELPDPGLNQTLAVRAHDGSHRGRYHRLSPFHPETRRIVGELYEDLGRAAPFAGVLFHDDAFLTDSEDASPMARDFYAGHWAGQAGTDPLAATGPEADAFARAKTRYLIDFTDELADVLRRSQPALETVRNLYARPATEPHSERWFAQNLRLFLDHYDYTAVMAMPYLEGARHPARWLADLVSRVSRQPGALERTVFELQTRDWQSGKPLSADTLAGQLDLLLDAGVRHIAWYPDDFIGGQPDLALLRSRVSLSSYPALAK